MALDLQRKWDDFRPTKTQAFWFGAGCVGVALALGFGPGGWVTGSKAQEMVSTAATESRQALAAAICVEEFMATADAGKRLAKLQKADWYDRRDLVAEGGWAKMPDREEVNYFVANQCAAKLAEIKPKTAKAM